MVSERRAAGIALALVAAVVLLVVATDARGDNVDRMSQARLERAAHRAVVKGGVHSTRWADASPWLRRLSHELVERAFGETTRGWALCVVGRESGFNPGAVSRTDDHGLPQINRPSHPWVNYARIVRDPVYAVAVMVRLSDHGASRGPWGWSC